MLQTFICRIAGAAERGTRQRSRIYLPPRAGAAARGRWPRGQAAAGGVGLRGRRPGLPAPPRRAPGDSGSAAPPPPVVTLSPWVTWPCTSRGGPSSFPSPGRMLASLPDSRHFTPALQSGSPRRPARPGTRLPRCQGAPPAAQPGHPGKAGALAACPASGRCFPLVQGRAARVKPKAVGDLLPAFPCFLVGSQISPYLTFLNTWQIRKARNWRYFSLGQAREGPDCQAICVVPLRRTFPIGSFSLRVLSLREASR